LFQVGQTYFVFVHGASAVDTGSFELSLVKRPVIDTCQGATTVEPLLGGQYSNADSTTPSTVQGTLIGASLDTGVPTCGDSIITSPGVWYAVYGTGGRMRAFFNEFGEETDFDARVSVFRGSCSSLECVGLDDALRWDSTAGELYSMLVHGADGSSGNFGLFVDLGNEFCTDVVNPLPSNETIVGGAVIGFGPNASSIDGLPLCELYPFEPSTGLVAWFSVVGTGATLLVSSCVFSPVFDVAVYSGSCGNLSCVEGLEQGIDIGSSTDDGYGGGYGYDSGYGYDGGYGNDGGYGGGGGEAFCPLFVSWVSILDEVYYIRAETPARNTGMNLVEYLIRVTEQSP
jgi:hypothetical protein